MAAGTASPTRQARVVARFGFDHGWLCLNPTFLNLQLPVLLVDHRLLPDPILLGLESFGSRNPLLPLPPTRIVVELHYGPMISLWKHSRVARPELLAWHRAATSQATWPAESATADTVIVMIGDTHRIQLSWAALWDGHIGRAQLVDTTRHLTGNRPDSDCRSSTGTA